MKQAPRVALITGASSGVGRATAIAFMSAGIHVAGTSRQSATLVPLAETAAQRDGEFLPVVADVRDAAAMNRAVAETSRRFGRLDILIANAGIGHTGSLLELSEEDIQQLLRTNLDGVIHSVRAAAPAMRATGGGQIIIVSSVVAPMTLPYAALYAASKAAVSSLARALYYELRGDGIHVSDFLLGRTRTSFNANRLGLARRNRPSIIPVMSAEQAASAILKALRRRQRGFVARPLDRCLLLFNSLFPQLVARQAQRIYGQK